MGQKYMKILRIEGNKTKEKGKTQCKNMSIFTTISDVIYYILSVLICTLIAVVIQIFSSNLILQGNRHGYMCFFCFCWNSEYFTLSNRHTLLSHSVQTEKLHKFYVHFYYNFL